MNKKGFEMGFQAIVMGILALIALAVLAYLFTSQVGKGSKEVSSITDRLGVDTCELFGTQRVCRASCDYDAKTKVKYQPVENPSGWKDCAKKTNAPKCCEPV